MPRGAEPGERRGGRARGAKNKHPTSFRTALRAYCDSLGVDPHRFMAEMIADDSDATKQELKFQAAKELAQYLEPKLKAVEHTGELDHTISVVKVILE